MGRIARTSEQDVADCVNCPVRLGSLVAKFSDDLASLDLLSTIHSFRPRQTLFNEGEKSQWVFLLTSGVARTFKSTRDGKQQGLGFAMPGDILGLVGAPFHGKTAEAISNVTARRIGRDIFDRAMLLRPVMLAHVWAQAERTMSAAHEQAVSLVCRTAQERLAVFLIELRNRLGCVCDSRSPLQIPMLQRDIADHIGISREATSRAFTNLAEQGILTLVSGGAVIENAAALEALAQIS
ncbi:MAG: Crp/Fnr family transcriptional regulator [Beijerinckiaceae bacterium]